MAVKAKPKAVKPAKEKATKALSVNEVLNNYRELTKTRYKMAMEVYEAQDNITKEVLDRIRDRLRVASTGVISVNGVPHKLEQEYVDFNLMFLATEILADLYLFNIKVANFKPTALYCAECKKAITKVREPKKKRGR